MTRMYELSSEEVIQICTALKSYIGTHQRMKSVLACTMKERILSDDEVSLYNHCIDEIGATQQVYNKFRSN